MFCTKCNKPNELAKNKKWCKICKNKYEAERRKNQPEDIKNKMRLKERHRYFENKKKYMNKNVEIDLTKEKKCTICLETKNIQLFYMHKNKGTVRSMCKNCSSIKRKNYYQQNKEKIIKQTSQYKVIKMNNNSIFKLEVRLRTRIYQAFISKNLKKTNRTWKYINCNPYFFQKWIEFQLYDGMNMDNYGKLWHLDHVIPCSKFNLNNQEDINKCFEWKNIRPYLAEKNIKKYNKINQLEIVLQELKVKYFLKKYI